MVGLRCAPNDPDSTRRALVTVRDLVSGIAEKPVNATKTTQMKLILAFAVGSRAGLPIGRAQRLSRADCSARRRHSAAGWPRADRRLRRRRSDRQRPDEIHPGLRDRMGRRRRRRCELNWASSPPGPEAPRDPLCASLRRTLQGGSPRRDNVRCLQTRLKAPYDAQARLDIGRNRRWTRPPGASWRSLVWRNPSSAVMRAGSTLRECRTLVRGWGFPPGLAREQPTTRATRVSPPPARRRRGTRGRATHPKRGRASPTDESPTSHTPSTRLPAQGIEGTAKPLRASASGARRA